MRGWSVRTLGPGSYNGNNSVSEFINQCGDIRLDINLEYRTKLFWKVELGAFIDAGNIWTIRDYESQPGGQFRLDSFYKEIALAYGLGIRLDFSYFLLRFDMGMKAYNPAAGTRPLGNRFAKLQKRFCVSFHGGVSFLILLFLYEVYKK